MTALAIFPLAAILWLLICDRLGLVADQPEGNDNPTQREDRLTCHLCRTPDR